MIGLNFESIVTVPSDVVVSYLREVAILDEQDLRKLDDVDIRKLDDPEQLTLGGLIRIIETLNVDLNYDTDLDDVVSL